MSLQDNLEQYQKQLQQEKDKLAELKSAELIEVAPTELPSENQEEQTTDNSTEVNEIEKQALEMGWKPDHKGPNYVSAKEFVERGSFFRKIDSQNKKIEELALIIKNLNEHYQKVEETTYKKGFEDAVLKRQEAVITGDIKAFNDAEAKLHELNQQRPKPVQTTNEPSETGRAFVERNKIWFNNTTTENAEMTQLAVAYGDFLQKTHPELNEDQIFKDVELTIKSMPKYKHRFETSQAERPSMVGKSTTSTISNKRNFSNRMSDSQKYMFDQAKKIDPKLDIEKYAKQLDMIGRLGNDK